MNEKRLKAARWLGWIGSSILILVMGFPLVVGLRFFRSGGPGFMYDFFFPAEVFPITAVGMALVLVAAFLAKARRKLAIIAAAVAIVGLVLSQVVAMLTGLADGRVEGGWPMALTIGIYALFLLGLLALALIGILVARDSAKPASSKA